MFDQMEFRMKNVKLTNSEILMKKSKWNKILCDLR